MQKVPKFFSSPGKIERLLLPFEQGRFDFGVFEGSQVTPFYDPMIGKIILHEKNRQEAIDIMTRILNQMVVDVGPLINQSAVEKVDEHVQDAIKHGAEVIVGGEQPEENGNFYSPTVIKGPTPDMLIMQEETFGPVAPVQKFETADEVIKLANDTPFGLAAYVFTENVALGTRVIEKLDFGIVGWNDGTPSAVQAPFRGMKESGLGREGGHQGIDDFLEIQYVSIGI